MVYLKWWNTLQISRLNNACNWNYSNCYPMPSTFLRKPRWGLRRSLDIKGPNERPLKHLTFKLFVTVIHLNIADVFRYVAFFFFLSFADKPYSAWYWWGSVVVPPKIVIPTVDPMYANILDGTKPFPEPILTYHRRCSVAFPYITCVRNHTF